jgi:hypothetical protein
MFKSHWKKLFAVSAAATMLAAFAVGGTAHADQYSNQSTPGFTVNAGVGPRFDDTYTDENPDGVFPTVNDFNDVTLNGTPQLTSATIDPFVVIDDSGSGTGWHVSLTLPNFVGDTPTNQVDATGASMSPPVVAPGTPGSDMGGVWGRGWHDFTGGRNIVEADPTDRTHNENFGSNTSTSWLGAPIVDGTHVAGMGTYLISPQILKLVVPVNTHADHYQTTATIAVNSGP